MSKAAPPEAELKRAQQEATQARKQLSSTIGALQYRLKPANLMHNAWDGVREKSSDVSDQAVHAAKSRPMTISGIIAALVIFFARDPLWRFVSGLFGSKSDEDEDLVTTDLETEDSNYDLTAPTVERSRQEGVIA